MPEHLDLEDVNSPTNALGLMKPIQVYSLLSHVGMHSTLFLRPCNLPSHACPLKDVQSNYGSYTHDMSTLLARMNKDLGSECERHNYLMSLMLDDL